MAYADKVFFPAYQLPMPAGFEDSDPSEFRLWGMTLGLVSEAMNKTCGRPLVPRRGVPCRMINPLADMLLRGYFWARSSPVWASGVAVAAVMASVGAVAAVVAGGLR